MSWKDYFEKGLIGNKMLTNERMQEMMDYLAGGCHMGGFQVAVENVFDCILTDQEMEQLEKFLEENECYECEYCGWTTHPGESCDCQDDEECPECGCNVDECECEG